MSGRPHEPERSEPTTTKTVRFRVQNGCLEPLEPVQLIEGSEMDVLVPVDERRSTIGGLLQIVESQPRIDPSLIEELNASIEAGKLPVRTGGVFDQKSSTCADLLKIMESQPHIDPSIVDEWEQAIEAGKVPVRPGGIFDDIEEE